MTTDARWLLSLVWPEHVERRERLSSAIDLARSRKTGVHRGDLVSDLPALLADVPPEASLVIFHTAVLCYINEEDRRHFSNIMVEASKQRDIVWISNESATIIPEIRRSPRRLGHLTSCWAGRVSGVASGVTSFLPLHIRTVLNCIGLLVSGSISFANMN